MKSPQKLNSLNAVISATPEHARASAMQLVPDGDLAAVAHHSRTEQYYTHWHSGLDVRSVSGGIPRTDVIDAVTRETEDPVVTEAPSSAVVEAAAPKLISIVLIDDNRLMREGIAAMIRAQAGFRVLSASADIEEALKQVRTAKPDVVLVDFGLADHDSLSLTATVHAEVPLAHVIVMGLLPAQEDVADYVRAGASGFIMKDATYDEFFATIRAVASGMQVLPKALTKSLFAQIIRNEVVTKGKVKVREAVRLTAREREVIDLLSEGLSNKDIGARLHIAIHTVKSHVHNVLEKLALRSRLEVAAFTHAAGGSTEM